MNIAKREARELAKDIYHQRLHEFFSKEIEDVKKRPSAEELGKVLRASRKQLGLSLEDVVYLLDHAGIQGFSRSTLSLMELGKQRLYYDQFIALNIILHSPSMGVEEIRESFNV